MTRRRFSLVLTSAAIRAASKETQLNWIALNLSGDIRASNWPDAMKPASLGSLMKPFLALAYLSTHTQPLVVQCRGAASGCWRPQGHGQQDLVSALANSCNVYFLQLAAGLDRAALDLTCLSYGLDLPSRQMPASRLIGLGEGWPQSRLIAARAFAALARNQHEPHVRVVLAGMEQCARSGTGRLVNMSCFAKTGTARCEHQTSGCGDGYAVAMYPLDQPRSILLAMHHNKTGADTAGAVRSVLHSL